MLDLVEPAEERAMAIAVEYASTAQKDIPPRQRGAGAVMWLSVEGDSGQKERTASRPG